MSYIKRNANVPPAPIQGRPPVPEPRSSASDSARSNDESLTLLRCRSVASLWPRLSAVTVWTSPADRWHEGAGFLLCDIDEQWHWLPFTDEQCSELIDRLMTLSQFDSNALLQVTGANIGGITPLWVRTQRDGEIS